jgi:phosphodiesterase/alkaline phosphatase D-like protein
VGQQLIMASVGIDDTWSGYPAARTRALAMFRDQPGANVVVLVLDVTHERVQAAWYLLSGVASSSYRPATFRTAWSVPAGARSLRHDERAASALRDWPALAP